MDKYNGIQATFSQEDIQALDVELKVGILGTVNEAGLPHLTMISSLRPYSANRLVWGQFTEGLSKKFIRQNPKTGFLIMSLDRQMWRGKALFTHTAGSGPEYDNFNNLPMFRYNAYFGIHTVYYMDLVELHGKQPLPMGQVIFAALKTILAQRLGRKRGSLEILTPWTRDLLNKIDNLKFLGYIGEDGFPVILPIIQARPLGEEQVIFSTGAFGNELYAIPTGISMAIFGMSFDMEDVLLRGVYTGIQRIGGMSCGVVAINWAYNSMPPTPQQIYPLVKVEAVKEF
jgi:hypothetical protein